MAEIILLNLYRVQFGGTQKELINKITEKKKAKDGNPHKDTPISQEVWATKRLFH